VHQTPRKRNRRIPAALLIFSTALGIRLAHLVSLAGQEWFFKVLLSDSFVYVRNAFSILRGEFLGQRVFYQDPFYPLFLAGFFKVNGGAVLDVLLFQILLSSAACLLLARSAEMLFDSPSGCLAGAAAALYPPWIHYDCLVLKTSPTLFLVSLYLYFAIRAARRTLGPGPATLALGMLCLLRGNFLLWIPAHFFFLGIRLASPLRSLARQAALLALLFAPVTCLNFLAGGDFVLLTSQGGQNFYTGNNPHNLTGYYLPVPFVRPSALFEKPDFRARAEQLSGKALSPSETSRFWYRQSLRFLREHPGLFFLNLFRKARVFSDRYEVPDNYDFNVMSRFSMLGMLVFFNFPLLWALALPGAAAGRKTPESGFLLSLLAIYTGSVILFFVYSRYRMPAVPLLCLFAAHAPVCTARELRSRRFLPATFRLAAALVLFTLLSRNPGRLRVDPARMMEIVSRRMQTETKRPER
jgi:hypothetical protein